MDDFYHPGQRELQDRFDSRRLADRIVEKTVQSVLDEEDKRLIERLPMFFLATVGPDGGPSCTFRGGDPGFVRVLDPSTLFWPEFDGNGMFLGLGNIVREPRVHLLFVDFQAQTRFRVEGRAEIVYEGPLVDACHGAKLGVVVRVGKAFPNCKRYIPKMEIVEPARHVPRPGALTPAADWKRRDWACDVLPSGDPALDPERPD
ncbi:MAG: pyridoxamine 5'-phosphate oxidase family protein [Armatimonadetes bacterium]|nr:pyridoxamine 5'-phosphate oxidase family protein [Armatimonadota bacterium]